MSGSSAWNVVSRPATAGFFALNVSTALRSQTWTSPADCSGIVNLATYLYFCRLERIQTFFNISNQMPRATKRFLNTGIALPSLKQ